ISPNTTAPASGSNSQLVMAMSAALYFPNLISCAEAVRKLKTISAISTVLGKGRYLFMGLVKLFKKNGLKIEFADAGQCLRDGFLSSVLRKMQGKCPVDGQLAVVIAQLLIIVKKRILQNGGS